MKRISPILVLAFMILAAKPSSVFAQQDNVWRNLAEVSYKISEDEFGELYVPVFSENIQKLEGKMVEADGYIIPFERDV